jgi:hypothetical protein
LNLAITIGNYPVATEQLSISAAVVGNANSIRKYKAIIARFRLLFKIVWRNNNLNTIHAYSPVSSTASAVGLSVSQSLILTKSGREIFSGRNDESIPKLSMSSLEINVFNVLRKVLRRWLKAVRTTFCRSLMFLA